MVNISEILRELNRCDFSYLTSMNSGEKLIDPLPRSFRENYYVEEGATKIVFVSKNENYVIKIPFCGQEPDDWGSYSCSDSRYDNSFFDCGCPSCYSPFEFAGEPNGWDYCKAEVLLYEKAKEAHLEKHFVKTTLIGYVNNHPIYLQQKATIFNDLEMSENYHYKSEEQLNRSKTLCSTNDVRCFNATWIADFIEYYDEETFLTLAYHLENNYIDDLHRSNLGYINGRPVIVDYAGYNEW